MIIIVPIKQVPDMSQVEFDTGRGMIVRSSAGAEINPFDLHALEAAVRIKEKRGGRLTAISMGPPKAEAALRDALARGADSAILLADEAFAGADTLATSYALARAIKRWGVFDLIICGEKTVDGDTGQVGPELAEHLGIPHIAYVSELADAGEKLEAVCDMDGESHTVESGFPVLLTVTKDINTPRLPAFRDKANARRAELKVWQADTIAGAGGAGRFGARGSPTRVHKVVIPSQAGRKGQVFRDAGDEAIDALLAAIARGTGET
jgi:electron transfer flavoprotein beta subunit